MNDERCALLMSHSLTETVSSRFGSTAAKHDNFVILQVFEEYEISGKCLGNFGDQRTVLYLLLTTLKY